MTTCGNELFFRSKFDHKRDLLYLFDGNNILLFPRHNLILGQDLSAHRRKHRAFSFFALFLSFSQHWCIWIVRRHSRTQRGAQWMKLPSAPCPGNSLLLFRCLVQTVPWMIDPRAPGDIPTLGINLPCYNLQGRTTEATVSVDVVNTTRWVTD